MAVNRTRLELFYAISSFWRLRDQRFLAAIGFEFEMCEWAMVELDAHCVRHTNAEIERWSHPPDDVPRLAIQARALVDHTVRIQKLVRAMAPDDAILGPLVESFFQQNKALFALRDSLHHLDTRIDSGDPFEHLQPLCGDFSWQNWSAGKGALDTYVVSFGPMIGEEFASPEISSTTTLRREVDHIRYRAHGHTLDLTTTFFNLTKFVEDVHDELHQRLVKQLEKEGVTRGGENEMHMPAGFAGRLRIEGLEPASP